MRLRFNADEVLEIAEQIERNGADFYARAAEQQQDSSAHSMLQELAAMEVEHEKAFSEMRAGLSDDERKELTFDPEGELPLYLRALADKSVFDKKVRPAEQLTGKESVEEILRVAIGLEKDSVVFYLGMHDLVPERLGGARIDDIVKEEMGHIASLRDLLQCAEGSGHAAQGE
jgi:rubrerythrin